MKTSQKAIDLIKKFEGFSAKRYLCPAGEPTIGYGHVILPTDKFNNSTTLTEKEAEEILKKDLVSREDAVNSLVKVKINQNKFDALVSLVYNIGIGSFKVSTLLKFTNDGLFEEVPNQFRRWKYVKGKISNGLIARREEEIKLWLS
jgi:lysozyme